MPEVLPRLQLALADRYRLDGEIGQGGMAVVFLAEDLRHGCKVMVIQNLPALVRRMRAGS